MKITVLCIVLGVVFSINVFSQEKFTVSGTPIPPPLVQQSYGRMPKGIAAYDLSICNITSERQALLSTQIYQALAESNLQITPIGRQIVLAAILQNQNRSFSTIFGVAFNSTTAILGLVSSSRSINLSVRATTVLGFGSIVLGQVINQIKPVLAPDKLEKFDREALEPALVLDGGSCVERTLFTVAAANKAQPSSVRCRVR